MCQNLAQTSLLPKKLNDLCHSFFTLICANSNIFTVWTHIHGYVCSKHFFSIIPILTVLWKTQHQIHWREWFDGQARQSHQLLALVYSVEKMSSCCARISVSDVWCQSCVKNFAQSIMLNSVPKFWNNLPLTMDMLAVTCFFSLGQRTALCLEHYLSLPPQLVPIKSY